MPHMSETDNDFTVKLTGPDVVLPAAGSAAATGATIIGPVVRVIKDRESSIIKYCLLGTLSVVSTGATMWLVGLSMNYAVGLCAVP